MPCSGSDGDADGRHDGSFGPFHERDLSSPAPQIAPNAIGFFGADLAGVHTAEGKLPLFVAIDRTSKFAVVELVQKPICKRPPQS